MRRAVDDERPHPSVREGGGNGQPARSCSDDDDLDECHEAQATEGALLPAGPRFA